MFFLEFAPEISEQKRPCTFLRIDFAEFAVTANSSRVNPQHNKLTLMAAPFPAWPGSRRLFAWDPTVNIAYGSSDSTQSTLGKEFSLAIADCEYRVPLTPRLARPVLLHRLQPVLCRHRKIQRIHLARKLNNNTIKPNRFTGIMFSIGFFTFMVYTLSLVVASR